MEDAYYNELVNRYNWYIGEIDNIRNARWANLSFDSFYNGIMMGKIKPQIHDIEWLEYAIEKLQKTLADVQRQLDRANYKRKNNTWEYDKYTYL